MIDTAPRTSSVVRKIPHGEMQHWDAWVRDVPGASIYHLGAWRNVINEVFGHRSIYLASLDTASKCDGMLPLVQMKSRLFGNFLVSLPYLNGGGAIAADEVVRSGLIRTANEIAAESGCTHVEFRQTEDLGLDLPVRTDKVKMVLELPDSVDSYSKAIGSKRRSQVNRARRENPEVVQGGAELLDDFYSVFARVMRDLGTPVYTRKLFASVCRHLEGETRVIVIRLQGQPVGAAILVAQGNTIEVPWAATLWSVNSLAMNMLLYFEAISFAIESGFEYFDFGRCTVDSGSYHFKKQWGAEKRQLFWYYWLAEGQSVPRFSAANPKYSLLSNMWRHLPVSVSKMLGPPIVRNIP